MNNDEKLVTLAIHTNEKAQILKSVLEAEGIKVSIDDVDLNHPGVSPGVRIRIQETDLPKALNVVENRHLFSYAEPETYRTDDGRKRILVPIDFSDYSLKACRIAFNLAKEINAKVKILHVYFNPYYPTALPMAEAFAYQGKEGETFQNIIEKVKADIQRLCGIIDEKIASGEFPPVNYSYVLREGLPEEEIVTFSKEYKPAMIVMGTRGKNQKDADLIGSVTAEVIEMTRIPVFTVPENTHFHSMQQVKNVAFLTNYSQRDLISFDSMMKFLTGHEVTVHFTHIADKEDKWDEIKLAGIRAYFTKQYPNLKTDYKVIEGDMLSGIDAFVKDAKIDILALTTAKRNIFARMFNPSMSRKMLFHTDTPLFVLRG
ncbi:nucleotide-binding universal stress UspA family protein [Dysgonomonas sp. PH5-45]|uniref:universal stress protein n=1 Tax=unclassified Dysgonomonas TaxID=2630389 RepID=UPI002474A635|nr:MULTISPECIES: universal stress protein [unclassified Dysgonomonas]MDH6355553.1 nucleotide-binding universal stress UspA family protein [Dysgonomonas sp. PH5-45]MDH6388450.1 nucleotide-binding universal stress UspA family protein [Dysgonomonas sp. PH5-37]